MSVYKDEKNGTWRCIYRYTNWKGERKQTQKRGFRTKREAQAWEREELLKQGAKLDMTFESFYDIFCGNVEVAADSNGRQGIINTELSRKIDFYIEV